MALRVFELVKDTHASSLPSRTSEEGGGTSREKGQKEGGEMTGNFKHVDRMNEERRKEKKKKITGDDQETESQGGNKNWRLVSSVQRF